MHICVEKKCKFRKWRYASFTYEQGTHKKKKKTGLFKYDLVLLSWIRESLFAVAYQRSICALTE